MTRDLKAILKDVPFTDDAKVMQQLVDHTLAVKKRMAHIRRKILVMSGKGGVGKSTVTAGLALALARRKTRVGILDVDFNGPCIPQLLGLQGEKFDFTPDGARPVQGPDGIQVASLDFLLETGAPARWQGPMDLSSVWLGSMEYSVLREMLSDIAWGPLDWWLADLPPGAAADKPPALAGFIPELDGAVIITTPSSLSLDVVRRSVAYARDAGIRPLGIVLNMASRVCSQCGHEEPAFEEGDTESPEIWARGMDLPVLARIPYDRTLGGAAADTSPAVRTRFDELASTLVQLIQEER